MDKIIAFVFESWNSGVHKIVSLSEEYQIGEHAHHYKYIVLVLVLLGILVLFSFICLLTLAATGTLHRCSYRFFVACFRVCSVSTMTWICYERIYGPVHWEYYSTNAFYGIAFTWALGVASFALYILSKLFYILVGMCCPLPAKDHSE